VLYDIYANPREPDALRRRALATFAYAAEERLESAIRSAYAGDDDWRATALRCMFFHDGFEPEIIESLSSENVAIRSAALRAAGPCELEEAWPHIRAVLREDLLMISSRAPTKTSPGLRSSRSASCCGRLRDASRNPARRRTDIAANEHASSTAANAREAPREPARISRLLTCLGQSLAALSLSSAVPHVSKDGKGLPCRPSEIESYIGNDRGEAMNTLRMLSAGLLLAATAAAAIAAEDENVPTVTVTAKRHTTVPASEGLPPRADIQISVVLPTDMPEAEIDYHLSPVAPPAPVAK
jgi:hypothetical protein